MNRKSSTISENKLFKTFDYLLIFLLLQINWLLILLNINRLELVLVPIVIILFYLKKRGILLNNKILLVFAIYTVLVIIQGIIWDISFVSLITSFSYTFLFPYCLYRIYNIDYFTLLEKVIRILTIISLLIWLMHQFIPGVKELIITIITSINKYNVIDIKRSMIFYTYWPQLEQSFGFTRNSGFASEPGAFAVYLILAIIINYQRKYQLFNRRNYLYYIALISTFSTAGYISFFVLGMLLLKQKRNRIFVLLLFPIMVYSSIYLFKNLEFMQKKIESKYTFEMNRSLNQPTSGRIYGSRKSLNVLFKYPLYGRGILASTKPLDISDPEFFDYGFLVQFARFGLIFGSLFMIYFLKGIYIYCNSNGMKYFEYIICLIAIMLQLYSQAFINNPSFMIFFFIGIYSGTKIKLKSESQKMIMITRA